MFRLEYCGFDCGKKYTQTHTHTNTYLSVIVRGSLYASIVHMLELSAVALIALKEEDERRKKTTHNNTYAKFLRL